MQQISAPPTYEVPYNPKVPNNLTKNLENSKKWHRVPCEDEE